MEIKGKVVVISGAGSGIGRALAVALAGMGADLAISDINKDRLDEIAEKLSSFEVKVHAGILDVARWEAVQRYTEEVVNHFGHVDVVINNAGVALGSFTLEEVTIDKFNWLMDINFWGMVYGSKAFLPHLRSRKESTLVNISSILGMAAIAKQAPYCASKFAIRGFSESLWMESSLDFPHVNILSVHPGGIQTNIARDAEWGDRELSEADKQKMATEFEKTFINTPEYAANDIINAIRKKKKRLLIGKDARQIWRLVRWFPVGYSKMLYKRLLKDLDPSLI